MDEQELELITVVDDEGNEHEFEILDQIETEDGLFYALLPTISSPEDSLDADTYYIFEVIEENGEEMLAEVADDSLSDMLAEQFEARFDEMFEVEE